LQIPIRGSVKIYPHCRYVKLLSAVLSHLHSSYDVSISSVSAV
jgi:hypothetical protein